MAGKAKTMQALTSKTENNAGGANATLSRRIDDTAALALHDDNPMKVYVDVALAKTGEVMPQHLWDSMMAPGSRQVHAAGFIPPLAHNMLFGRIVRKYEVAATDKYKTQTVVVVEGIAIMYQGDVKKFKRTKTDPAPAQGQDLRAFLAEHYRGFKGVFNAALMAALEPLQDIDVGAAVRIVYGDYEPISDERTRKTATCDVWEGELANDVLKVLGV